MKVGKLREELEKENQEEEILVERGGFRYDFDLGMDDNKKPLIVLMKAATNKGTAEARADQLLKMESSGITDSWKEY